MATTITRTFDATPTDKTYFSLTDNMSSSNLGNIQVPDGASRISRVDCAFDTTNAKGYQVVCRLSGSILESASHIFWSDSRSIIKIHYVNWLCYKKYT